MDQRRPHNDSDLAGVRVARAMAEARRPLAVAGMVVVAAIAVTVGLGLWSLAGLPPIPGEGWWQLLAMLSAMLAMPVGGGLFLIRAFRVQKLAGQAGAAAAERQRAAGSMPAAKVIDADSALGRALRVLEDERRPVAAALTRRRTLFAAIGLVIGLVMAWGIISNPSSKNASPLLGAIVAVIVCVGMAYAIAERYAPAKAYADRFKATILPALLAEHGAYVPVVPPPGTHALIVDSGLTGASAPFLALEDCFAGEHKGAQMVFGEMRQLGRSKKGEPEPDNPVFAGIFVHAQSRYPLSARLQVMSADAHPESATAPSGSRLIRLEDPVFGAAYLCHCTDEVEARAVLTPTMMQTMLELGDGLHFLPPALYAHGRDFLVLLPHFSALNDFLAIDPTANDAQAQLEANSRELDRLFALVDSVLEAQRVRLGARNI